MSGQFHAILTATVLEVHEYLFQLSHLGIHALGFWSVPLREAALFFFNLFWLENTATGFPVLVGS